MTSTFSRRTFLTGSAAAAATLALPQRLFAANGPLPVGFVYVGPISDHGYTYAHDLGRKEVEKHYGDQVKVSYVENVAATDAERVIRQLASAGNKLIFSTSFSFMNPTVKVASQFPNVMFEHATGFKQAKNLAIYNARFYEGRAVLGDIAGQMTKTGVIGWVASFPIPEVIMGMNAFIIAARKHRPDLTIKVVWCNSWYDPGKEADAAKALIDKGADVICQHTDSAAPMQVAEARGVYTFGHGTDMSRFAPKMHLTASIDEWGGYYIDRVGKALNGGWSSTNSWWGLKEGMVGITPYNPIVPEAVRVSADKVKAGIIDGSLHPFAGPVKDQKGTVRIAAGQTPTDTELLKMDWYAEGIEN
ncbi:MAG: BMP family ABC transporter substrate-binding protein [Rhodospirillaceae bacterium]|nr:BMP family ABC transporter substrate-binding protein [Rhodospirillaceae bacterium]